MAAGAMGEESELHTLTPAPGAGFVSGNETNLNWSDAGVVFLRLRLGRPL